MAKPKVIRTKQRLRLGPRSALLLALLLILIWLIATILGHRPGGEETEAPEASTPAAPRMVAAKVERAEGRPPEVDQSLSFEVARWRPAEFQQANAEVEAEVSADGAYLEGSAYLRFQLPEHLDLNEIVIKVAAVHATLPGIAGRRVLRAIRRIEPDLIILQVASLPGGLWLELSDSKSSELHGPFELRPLGLLDLGRLSRPETMIDLSDRSDLEQLQLAAQSLPLPGESRPCWAPEAAASSRLRRAAEELLRGPRQYYGPYQLEARRQDELPASHPNEPTHLLDEDWPAGGVVIASAGGDGRDELRVIQETDSKLRVPQSSRLLFPGGGSFDLRSDPEQPKIETARLRVPLGFSKRFAWLAADGAPQDATAALDRELLLFAEANFSLDPEDPSHRIWPFRPGTYELIDLNQSEPSRRRLRSVTLGAGSTTTLELPAPAASHQLTLRVTDQKTGAAIAGAVVSLTAAAPGVEWLPSRQLTDDQGYFIYSGLPELPLELGAWAEGYLKSSQKVEIGPHLKSEIELSLPAGPGLSLRAVDPKGETVRVDGFVALGQTGVSVQVPLGEDGQAHFPRLSPDRYVILPILGAAMTQMDDWQWLVGQSGGLLVDHPKPSSAPLEFQMPALRRVELHLELRGFDGSFDFHIVPAENLPAPGLWPRIHQVQCQAGPLVIDGLPPGRYRAVASQDAGSALADFEVQDLSGQSFSLVLDFN